MLFTTRHFERYAISYPSVHMATGVRRISPCTLMSSLLHNAQGPCSKGRPRACAEALFVTSGLEELYIISYIVLQMASNVSHCRHYHILHKDTVALRHQHTSRDHECYGSRSKFCVSFVKAMCQTCSCRCLFMTACFSLATPERRPCTRPFPCPFTHLSSRPSKHRSSGWWNQPPLT